MIVVNPGGEISYRAEVWYRHSQGGLQKSERRGNKQAIVIPEAVWSANKTHRC